MADATRSVEGTRARRSVVICGGGVAAVEALLALRAHVGMGVEVEVVAPNHEFVYEPLAVAEPFGLADTRCFDLASVTEEYGARLHVAALDSVAPASHRIGLRGGGRIFYDSLIVAVGARHRDWLPGAFHFAGAGDVSRFRELLAALERGSISRIAFAAPAGLGWMLPTYELALLTASWIADRHITDVELTVVTPEPEPLGSFGPAASRAMRDVLADRGIRLRLAADAEAVESGVLRLGAGGSVPIDRVVALPQLTGPGVTGLPTDEWGFIPIDQHARVPGIEHVYAAGDATSFPIKQGGIATQQADAAVEMIAAGLGAGVRPSAFEPVLRGMLLTGVAPTYLRAAGSGEFPGQGELAATPLWWPPTKIAGRYLGPYLSRTSASEQRASRQAQGSARTPAAQEPAGQRQARELALSFALADANSEDYSSALRWLEVVEQLEGVLPPSYLEKREQWRSRVGS